jgi:hypothetical protein
MLIALSHGRWGSTPPSRLRPTGEDRGPSERQRCSSDRHPRSTSGGPESPAEALGPPPRRICSLSTPGTSGARVITSNLPDVGGGGTRGSRAAFPFTAPPSSQHRQRGRPFLLGVAVRAQRPQSSAPDDTGQYRERCGAEGPTSRRGSHHGATRSSTAPVGCSASRRPKWWHHAGDRLPRSI